MENSLIDLFVDNIVNANSHDLQEKLNKHVRCHLLDYVGVTLAGATMQKSKNQKFLDSMPKGDFCVIGSNRKTDLFSAAFTNGINAHYVELDDGHRQGMMHLEAPIFSALLSLFERERFSLYDFIKGVVIGYEVAVRLAKAIQPSHKLKGYHTTGTCGTIGVAAAVATVLHLDATQMKDALSAAMTSAAGLLEMIEDDSELKPYNVGRCVVDGIFAAYSGNAGFHAPKDALGGKRGFLAVSSEKPNLDYLKNFDPDSFMIESSYLKPYAACRHLHPAIEGALMITKTSKFDWHNVKKIIVDAYKLAVFGHDHHEVSSVNSAKMSIPYSVAVALIKGSANIEDFLLEAVSNTDVLALAKKVFVRENEELSKLCPDKRASIVTVIFNDGSQIQRRIDYPKGEPENPLTKEELEDKFRGLAMYGGLTEKECDEVINEVWKEDLDLQKIMNIVCK
jgi:2-methylcitrate dehydratase PrpD